MSFNSHVIPNAKNHPGSTESGLLAAARRQDAAAWKELVDRYSWLVYRWGRQGGLDSEEAGDVLQVVMLQVWKHLENFKKDGRKASFRRWLRAITRSKVASHLRSRSGQPRAEGGSAALEQLHQAAADGQDSGTAPVQIQRRLDDLGKLLHRIEGEFEESTWQAFWLTVVENKTSNEAAQALGISPGAVRIAKCRILNRLRTEARLHRDPGAKASE